MSDLPTRLNYDLSGIIDKRGWIDPPRDALYEGSVTVTFRPTSPPASPATEDSNA